MFSSLVAPHGSTSNQEHMNMNAFKKTLVALVAVATLGATGQASAGYYSYGGYGGGYGYSQPSYGYGYSAPSYGYNSYSSYGYGRPSYGYGYGYGHRW
jgi:hypothetical protein